MSKRLKTFRFATNNVMVAYALFPKLREHGYITDLVEKLPNSIINKGVTFIAGHSGAMGVAYTHEHNAIRRLDDLLVLLKSDNFEKST